jgi:hypothetical protein
MKYDVYLSYSGYKKFHGVEANTPEEAYDKVLENPALISEAGIEDFERWEQADMVREETGAVVFEWH